MYVHAWFGGFLRNHKTLSTPKINKILEKKGHGKFFQKFAIQDNFNNSESDSQ